MLFSFSVWKNDTIRYLVFCKHFLKSKQAVNPIFPVLFASSWFPFPVAKQSIVRIYLFIYSFWWETLKWSPHCFLLTMWLFRTPFMHPDIEACSLHRTLPKLLNFLPWQENASLFSKVLVASHISSLCVQKPWWSSSLSLNLHYYLNLSCLELNYLTSFNLLFYWSSVSYVSSIITMQMPCKLFTLFSIFLLACSLV